MEAIQPLQVIEDEGTGDRFVAYTTKEGVGLDLRFDGEEPWFTQLQLADMYGVDVRSVSDHIQKFMSDGELDESVIRNFRITARDGKSYDTKHYGLDVAFYVGYRVNSSEGKLFRKCEGFRMAAHCERRGAHGGRRSKASRERTRERWGATAPRGLWGFRRFRRRGEPHPMRAGVAFYGASGDALALAATGEADRQ